MLLAYSISDVIVDLVIIVMPIPLVGILREKSMKEQEKRIDEEKDI